MEPSQVTSDRPSKLEYKANCTSPTTNQSSERRWVSGVLGVEDFIDY